MKSKIFFAILAFSLLIIASEFIYQFRSKANFRFLIFLNMAKISSLRSPFSVPVGFLGKAAKIRIEQVSEKYPQMEFNQELVTPTPTNNEKLINEYEKFLNDLDYERLNNSYDVLGYIYYHLGLLSYNQGESELAVAYWQNASRIAPEWSYFHIELANYYLNQGDLNNAKAQLEYCFQFKFPRVHCDDFMKNNLEINSPEYIGFLQSKIEEEI